MSAEAKGTHTPPAGPVTQTYPQLERIEIASRRGRIPYIQQLAVTDCGAACLAMVLAHFGKPTRLQEVSEAMQVGRDGATALAILDTARWYGLRGRGLKLEPEHLAEVAPGAILHWGFSHFVVFERWRRGGAVIIDPAFGRRRVREEELRQQFTGVALLLEPGAQFERGAAGAHPVRAQLWATLLRSGAWVRILGASLLLQLFALALPMLTGAVVDRVIPRGDERLLYVLIAGLGGIVGFYFLSSMIRAHLLLHLRVYFDSRMTLGFLDHLFDLPFPFFQRRRTGDLMMRLNSTSTIREMITSGVLSGVLDGSLVLVYLVVLLAIDRMMGGLVMLLGLAQIAVVWLSRRRQRDLLAENLQTRAASESQLVEMLAGIETLKSMGTELDAAERWSGLFVDQLNVSIRRGRLSAWTESLSASLKLAAPLAILAYGALGVLHGRMTLGTAMALLALAEGFLTPLANLVGVAGQLQLLGGYVDRLEDVLATPPEQERGTHARAPMLTGAITLDHVSFRYHASAPEVVRDVSLTIAPGQFVAVVGRSGSGKSTLAGLLLGLYQPTAGRILYDGVNIAELDARSLRRQLGIVNQRPYLFAGSIRANLASASPGLTFDEIVEAARRACIHDEIARMPMGYESVLNDGGSSLSGGQRQRVALARALARRPAVLLLDEATSALDAVTERAVQAELQALGGTRVVIAHRLSTVRRADVILVMHDGQLVEKGTHDELMGARGLYADLVRSDMSGPSALLPLST